MERGGDESGVQAESGPRALRRRGRAPAAPGRPLPRRRPPLPRRRCPRPSQHSGRQARQSQTIPTVQGMTPSGSSSSSFSLVQFPLK